MTTELVGSSKPGGVRGRKSSSGSEMTERQSSQGGRLNVIGPKKRNKTNLDRRKGGYSWVKPSWTHDWINMFFLLNVIPYIM